MDSPYCNQILTEHYVFQTGGNYNDKILELKNLIFLGTLPFSSFCKSIIKPEHLHLKREFQPAEIQRPLSSSSMDDVNSCGDNMAH